MSHPTLNCSRRTGDPSPWCKCGVVLLQFQEVHSGVPLALRQHWECVLAKLRHREALERKGRLPWVQGGDFRDGKKAEVFRSRQGPLCTRGAWRAGERGPRLLSSTAEAWGPGPWPTGPVSAPEDVPKRQPSIPNPL